MDVDGDRFYLRKHYSEALFHAGGVPVLLPLIPEKKYALGLIEGLDGIILSGSNSDVDPHSYGEEPHPKIGSIMSRRDLTDWYLLEEVFRTRKPLLGICFGMQILNVFLGGTLWQDIQAQVEGAINHSQNSLEEYRAHTVRIRPTSRLYSLVGKKQLRVNSYHHQAVKKVAPSLIPVATATDGIVESVEFRDKKHYVFAVQWHPEIGWENDPVSQKIFSQFAEIARNRKAN